MIGGPYDGEYATFDDNAPLIVEVPMIKDGKEESFYPTLTYHKYHLNGLKDVMQNVVYVYISEDLTFYDALKMLINNYEPDWRTKIE